MNLQSFFEAGHTNPFVSQLHTPFPIFFGSALPVHRPQPSTYTLPHRHGEPKKTHLCAMRNLFIRLTDFFYIRPLRRVISQETFRYAFVGGMNLGFNAILYWFCYNFVLGQQDTDFGFVVISAPILAFLITFVITFFTGFYLARNVAFGHSRVHGAKQLFRYAQVVAVNIGINYFGLRLLVRGLNIYPSVANVIIQIVTVIFSYLAQRFCTFRTHRSV